MVAALLSGGTYAQAIMEHAAAAAGATVGTAGGKALSNMIDKALSKAANPEVDASAARKPKSTPAAPASSAPGPQAAAAPTSPSTPGPTRRARAARPPAPVPDKPAFPTAQPNLSAPVFAAAPPPAIEDFAKVKEGSAREDVFAALGTPSSHITIPDDGHLIEILSYSDGRQRLGSVRLDNGQVVSVSTAR
jgi:hypothetical protein